MTNFCILKVFNVQNHFPKIIVITKIIWQSLPLNWIKCNLDSASKGNPDPSACEDIFRDNQDNDLGCFASNLNVSDTAELIGANTAIEIAHRCWNHLWLKCDFKLVALVFKSQLNILWKLRNCWNNCLHLCRCSNSLNVYSLNILTIYIDVQIVWTYIYV
jgi:hypothetical protein